MKLWPNWIFPIVSLNPTHWFISSWALASCFKKMLLSLVQGEPEEHTQMRWTICSPTRSATWLWRSLSWLRRSIYLLSLNMGAIPTYSSWRSRSLHWMKNFQDWKLPMPAQSQGYCHLPSPRSSSKTKCTDANCVTLVWPVRTTGLMSLWQKITIPTLNVVQKIV